MLGVMNDSARSSSTGTEPFSTLYDRLHTFTLHTSVQYVHPSRQIAVKVASHDTRFTLEAAQTRLVCRLS